LEAGRLALLLAASLREGLEEMRLNPLGVTFLGPLSAQRLQMFDRVIYPMAGWMNRQKRFFPNWEVEKIVHIPLGCLLNSSGYRCYRLQMAGRSRIPSDFPCFLHQSGGVREVLWGATYRITTLFLELIFGFSPPPLLQDRTAACRTCLQDGDNVFIEFRCIHVVKDLEIHRRAYT